MAAKAYDVAAYCLKGSRAHFNFPDEIDLLPRPASRSPRDIQAAAALAAEAVLLAGQKLNDKNTGAASSAAHDHNDDDDFWREIELPELNNGVSGAWPGAGETHCTWWPEWCSSCLDLQDGVQQWIV